MTMDLLLLPLDFLVATFSFDILYILFFSFAFVWLWCFIRVLIHR